MKYSVVPFDVRHSGFVNGLHIRLFIELSGFTPRLGSLPCVLASVTPRVVNGKCETNIFLYKPEEF